MGFVDFAVQNPMSDREFSTQTKDYAFVLSILIYRPPFLERQAQSMQLMISKLAGMKLHPEIPVAVADRQNLSGGVFYPLPIRLVALAKGRLAEPIGEVSFSDEVEIAERADERDAAAFRDGKPIQYRYLIARNSPLTVELFRAAGFQKTEKEVNALNDFLSHDYRYEQAYCGWLVSQDEFWNDIDQVVASREADNAALAPPIPGILGVSGLPLANNKQATEIRAYKELYEKWRLQTLATHDLPVCLSPQLTNKTVYNPNALEGTINPVIPDIFPIDGKGMINRTLEAASRDAHAPHLESWKVLIGSSSRTKKKLDTFCRRFVLQHYWRVLTQRYPKELSRKAMLLDTVFSEYFSVSTDMIRSDRSELEMLLERPLGNR